MSLTYDIESTEGGNALRITVDAPTIDEFTFVQPVEALRPDDDRGLQEQIEAFVISRVEQRHDRDAADVASAVGGGEIPDERLPAHAASDGEGGGQGGGDAGGD